MEKDRLISIIKENIGKGIVFDNPGGGISTIEDVSFARQKMVMIVIAHSSL